ncbi:MAG TPA: hypothetical protein VFJ74_18155, partial [Gemmatimonadaceae bacterium]|nr:hypothetical protein [Gemmatimonadaceae bacterium]
MMPRRLLPILVAVLGVVACTDASKAPTVPDASPAAARAAAADRVTAAALWEQRTRAIIGRRGGSSNFAARTFALVSVAEYDAVIAAENAKDGGLHPSEAGASSAAAASVLAALYPAEQSFITTQLAADAAYFPTLPSERDTDWDAGVEVG